MDDQSALPTAPSGMMATLASVGALVLLPLLQKVCLCIQSATKRGLTLV